MKIKLNNGKEVELRLINEQEESMSDIRDYITWKKYTDGTTEEWDYDRHGNLIWHKLRDGSIEEFVYDRHNRIIMHMIQNADIFEEWGYNRRGVIIWHRDCNGVYWIKGEPYCIKRDER